MEPKIATLDAFVKTGRHVPDLGKYIKEFAGLGQVSLAKLPGRIYAGNRWICCPKDDYAWTQVGQAEVSAGSVSGVEFILWMLARPTEDELLLFELGRPNEDALDLLGSVLAVYDESLRSSDQIDPDDHVALFEAIRSYLTNAGTITPKESTVSCKHQMGDNFVEVFDDGETGDAHGVTVQLKCKLCGLLGAVDVLPDEMAWVTTRNKTCSVDGCDAQPAARVSGRYVKPDTFACETHLQGWRWWISTLSDPSGAVIYPL